VIRKGSLVAGLCLILGLRFSAAGLVMESLAGPANADARSVVYGVVCVVLEVYEDSISRLRVELQKGIRSWRIGVDEVELVSRAGKVVARELVSVRQVNIAE
jgi:hypothetical protein